MLWAQLFAIIPLVLMGIFVAQRLKAAKTWWLGFLLPLGCVALVLLGHRSVRLSLIPPISWAVDAAITPFLMAWVVPLLFTTLMLRLPRPRRAFIQIVTAAMVVVFALLPSLCPLLARPALAAGRTRFDRHGVCLQTTGYTCGPAAAVTCLRQVGISAEEGPLAIAAACGPIVGTDSRLLARTLTSQFMSRGLHCESRYAASLDELSMPCIAETFTPRIGGHYVAVLSIGIKQVEVGDPFSGWHLISRKAFEDEWTHRAITFTIAGEGDRWNALATKNR